MVRQSHCPNHLFFALLVFALVSFFPGTEAMPDSGENEIADEPKSLKFLRFPAASLIDRNFAVSVLRYSSQTASINLPTRIQLADQAYDQDNFRGALNHYRKAAYYGDKFSQFRLGEMYVSGIGKTPRDIPLGMAWLALASESASLPEAANTYIQNVWQQMDRQQKLSAQQRLDELAPTYSNVGLLTRLDRFYSRRFNNRTGTRLKSTPSRLSNRGAGLSLPRQLRQGVSSPIEEDLILEEYKFVTLLVQNIGTVTIGELELIDDEP